MHAVPFFLTLLVWFPQGTRITCSLCTNVCVCVPTCPPHFPHQHLWVHWSINQLWSTEGSNSWTLFDIRQVGGEKRLYSCSYRVKKLRVNTTLMRGRESTRESSATNIPSEEPVDNHTWQGTREPITYNSKLSSTWIFRSQVRHKAQSKLWRHIAYSFLGIVHSKWQIHICKFSWPWDRNPLETRLPPFQNSQK